MPENKNIDPLEALLAKQKAAMEGKQVDEVESVSFADETLVEPSDEDIYGENDLAEDIANEEANEKAERAALAAEMAEAQKKRESEKVFMPPDEHDMKYHEEAGAAERSNGSRICCSRCLLSGTAVITVAG